jgi:hypothetical protein
MFADLTAREAREYRFRPRTRGGSYSWLLLTYLRPRMRVEKRRLANPPASTTSASAISRYLQTLPEGCISSSGTSTRTIYSRLESVVR